MWFTSSCVIELTSDSSSSFSSSAILGRVEPCTVWLAGCVRMLVSRSTSNRRSRTEAAAGQAGGGQYPGKPYDDGLDDRISLISVCASNHPG